MKIEQAAREYIRLRRLRLTMKAERFRLMNLCPETDWPDDDFGRFGFSECLCGYDDYDQRVEGWDRVNAEGVTADEECTYCAVALRAHEAYLRTANRCGAALRRLEREVNR